MAHQYRNSFWETTSLLRPVDIAIVGGGLTGLQTAIGIKNERPDLDVLLIERAPFSRGASTRNAGFACFGSPSELLEDLESGNSTAVWDTVARRYAGIRKLAEAYGADCNYRPHGGYEIFYGETEAYRKVVAALPELNAEFAKATGGGPAWKLASGAPGINTDCRLVYCKLEGQLHPGKLVQKLMAKAEQMGIRCLYGLTVADVAGEKGAYELTFADQNGHLNSKRVVVATNAFSRALVGDLPIQPARNQVFITEPLPNLRMRGCFHHERGYVYFRNVGADRLLIGGARHLAGLVSETTDFGTNTAINERLLDYLKRALPREVADQLRIEQSWSGIIAQGGKSPIVARLDNGTIVAARLSGMGVALSAQVAREATLLALS